MTTRLMSACHHYAHNGARIALGVFIVWQLVYFAIANGLETLEVVTLRYPETAVAITKALDASRNGRESPLGPLAPVVFAVDKYGQLTEQPQRWSLFAPNISDQTAFLAYELHWDGWDESVWLLSEDEPKNAASYVRFLGSRLRSLEQNLTVGFSFEPGETEAQARQRWALQTREELSRDVDVLLAWSHLRLEAFQQAHQGVAPPDEVIIHIRGYQIAGPHEQMRAAGQSPYCLAIARWRPAAEYPAEVLPLEVFNHATQQFAFQPWNTESDE